MDSDFKDCVLKGLLDGDLKKQEIQDLLKIRDKQRKEFIDWWLAEDKRTSKDFVRKEFHVNKINHKPNRAG